MQKKTWIPVLGLALVLAFAACIRKQSSDNATQSPEEVVRQFVELSANASTPADKGKLQALCSGPMYTAFGDMPDEVFRLSYLTAKIKLVDFKILETVPQGESVLVRYRVTVQNDQGTDPTRETSEREVEVLTTGQGLSIRAIRARGSDEIAFTHGMIF